MSKLEKLLHILMEDGVSNWHKGFDSPGSDYPAWSAPPKIKPKGPYKPKEGDEIEHKGTRYRIEKFVFYPEKDYDDFGKTKRMDAYWALQLRKLPKGRAIYGMRVDLNGRPQDEPSTLASLGLGMRSSWK